MEGEEDLTQQQFSSDSEYEVILFVNVQSYILQCIGSYVLYSIMIGTSHLHWLFLVCRSILMRKTPLW